MKDKELKKIAVPSLPTHGSITQMFLGFLGDVLAGIQFLTPSYEFPSVIYGYTFLEEIDVPTRNKNYHFALYGTKAGKRAIAKVWSGRIRTSLYRELLHEAQMYDLVSRAQHRIPTKKVGKRSVKIPDFLGFYTFGISHILLTSYQPGEKLGDVVKISTVSIYTEVVTFLKKLDAVFLPSERKKFPQRKPSFYLVSYPYLVVKAVLTHPKLAVQLLRGVPVFFRGMGGFFQPSALTLTHRDLHGKNIIVSSETITLLDFQFMTRTIPEYEWVSSFAFQGHSDAVIQFLSKLLKDRRGVTPDKDPFIQTLMIFFITHMFTSRNFSQKRQASFERYLHMVLSQHQKFSRDPLFFTSLQKIVHIVPTYLHSSILYVASRKKEVSIPKSIGSYTLIEPVPTARKYPYAVGAYEDPNGNRVVGKFWKGKKYSLHAFNIIQEAKVCRTLTVVAKRIRETLPSYIANIQTPKFVDFVQENGYLALFMTPAQGTPLSFVDDLSIQLSVHERARAYLAYFGFHMTSQERRELGEKRLGYFLLLYPLIFFVSVFRHVDKIGELIAGTAVFFRSIDVLSNSDVVLTHGDLHTDNILVHDKMIEIIDLEQGGFTYPEYDLMAIISSRRSSEAFRTAMEQQFIEEAEKSQLFRKRLSGMGVFVSTHNLTSNLSPAHTAHYYQMLKFANRIGDKAKTFVLPNLGA